MPYKNMPKEKWPAMERCVEDVLNKNKGKEGFGKENAVAICYSTIIGGLSLEPISAEDLTQYGNHALFANTEPGALLRFKNADLCSAGENKNHDWIDAQGIRELADTMPFRAIDDEHQADRVIGFFVNPRAENDRLITDGIIYADRFPEIVAQVQNGTKKLSVEAGARRAVCSVCGSEFVSIRDYCEHLKDKVQYGAVRKLYGLKAKGGATVFHPAWDTSFDANGFVMIASQIEYDKPLEVKVETPNWVTDLTAKIEGLISRLKPVAIEGGDDEVGLSGEMAAVELLCLAIEAAKKEKWSKDVDLKEGSLEALGWPDYSKLAQAVRSGKVSYSTLIKKLGYLRNITKDSGTKSKAANFMERLKNTFRKEDNKSEGGVTMGEVNVDELNLQELGLVQASELTDLEAKLATKDAEVQKLKVGFARVLELGMEAGQLEILADMSEDAYQLLKAQQKKKVKPTEEEPKEEEPKPEEEEPKVKGAVLEAVEVKTGVPLTWETVSNILKLKEV